MAAVGDGQCVCTGCGVWLSFVVHLLFLGHCGCLWLFVFVGVVVVVVAIHCVGGRRWSSCALMVVVRRRATTSCCQTNIVCYP